MQFYLDVRINHCNYLELFDLSEFCLNESPRPLLRKRLMFDLTIEISCKSLLENRFKIY